VIGTDKVDNEIPAPVTGVLTEIRVQQGETVPVATVIAVIS
jgi:pyruvate/2-oxoglutarate dehydrogenase complex dihydrolipoamide acyltransferase (E2) component